ncbi:GerMN domain-containing protein [Kribbella sp. NBC_01505]|uniref:Gmad2 immunoglobulin-like domain-containing protein n=1 Tax=Kribbella sp. NBC_01505 TaxID=2903580 RepID=UPI00387018DA
MNDNPNDSFDELMRRSLANEANRIEPTDALPEILTRAHAVRRPVVRRPWVMTAGLAAVGTAAAIGAFTVINSNLNQANEGDTVAGQGNVASASGAPTTAPIAPRSDPTKSSTLPPSERPSAMPEQGVREKAVSGQVVPVYWLGNAAASTGATDKPTTKPSMTARSETRLYRTWSKITGRPAFEAVRVMTREQPKDADYYSVWKGAQVSSVTLNDRAITVDFKAFPQARVDDTTASMAAQQLIYTVQGALGDDSRPVQVTLQGKTGGMLFGQVDTSTPLGRAQAADVQALVSIESPTEGMLATSPVTVQGVAAAWEGTVNYRAINVKTKKEYTSVVNTKEGQKFSPFSFELKLTPGIWQIEAYLDAGPDGKATDLDTKTIEVSR